MRLDERTSCWNHAWRLSVLTLLVVCAYSCSLHAPFVFDDQARIADNEAIRTAWPLSEPMQDTNRPFAFVTFAWNYALHGLEPLGFHVVNLLIHVANAILLYFLVLYSTRGGDRVKVDAPGFARVVHEHSSMIAWSVALVWSLHPLATQAVTYTVQRLESLMSLGYLATLLAFSLAFRSELRSRVWRLVLATLSVAACALAMGCKEVAVTIPVAVLWYDRAFVARNWRMLFRERYAYYLCLFATWGVLSWAMLRFTGDYTGGALMSVEGLTPWTYLVHQSLVITHYLRLAVWPHGLCFFYNWPIEHELWRLWPYCLFLSSLGAAAIWLAIRSPKLGFVVGMFFLVLSPTSSVVPIEDLAFEHRMYLPLATLSVFLCLAVVGLLSRFALGQGPRSKAYGRMAVYGLLTPGVLILAWLTFQRNSVYQSHISLWHDTVVQAPQNYEAWHNLAVAYQDAGDLESALDSFAQVVRVMQQSSRPSDHERADALASYGAALVEAGELEKAESELQQALEHEPTNYLAARNLGAAMLRLGKPDEAKGYLEAALRANASDVELKIDMGAAAAATGAFYEAIRLSEEVLRSEPFNAQAHVNLACGLGGLGRTEKAVEHCRMALKAAPSLPNAHGTLALLLGTSAPLEARRHLELAAELENVQGMYDAALGDMCLAQQDSANARLWFEKALAKEPTHVGAHLGLFEIFRSEGQMELAIQHLRLAVELRPEWPELRQQLQALTGADTPASAP